MIKKHSLNICSFILFHHSSCSSNDDFLRFVFTFNGSGSGPLISWVFLARRIIEPQSSANLIASFLRLKSLLILDKDFFADLFPILIFFRSLLQSSCLGRAFSIGISHFVILSRKATGSFNS